MISRLTIVQAGPIDFGTLNVNILCTTLPEEPLTRFTMCPRRGHEMVILPT